MTDLIKLALSKIKFRKIILKSSIFSYNNQTQICFSRILLITNFRVGSVVDACELLLSS